MKYWLLLLIIFLNGCTFKDLKYTMYSSDKNKNEFKIEHTKKLLKENFKIKYNQSMINKVFTRKNGKMGLWSPYTFLTEIGGGLYEIENKNRTPLFFIHGITGCPKGFNKIVKSIKTKYKPIMIYYPSGLDLQITAEFISQKIQEYVKVNNINKVNIIAHSMGGLIALKVSNLIKKNNLIVDNLITLSSPFKGFEGAQNTTNLPYFYPSWLSMSPYGVFINSLREEKISKEINHYVLFSYKGEDNFLINRNNDGKVSIKTQLPIYIQENAKKIYGLNETHISILESEDAIKLIKVFLKIKTNKNK